MLSDTILYASFVSLVLTPGSIASCLSGVRHPAGAVVTFALRSAVVESLIRSSGASHRAAYEATIV